MAVLWLTVGAVYSMGLIRTRQRGLAILVPHPSSPMLCLFGPPPISTAPPESLPTTAYFFFLTTFRIRLSQDSIRVEL